MNTDKNRTRHDKDVREGSWSKFCEQVDNIIPARWNTRQDLNQKILILTSTEAI